MRLTAVTRLDGRALSEPNRNESPLSREYLGIDRTRRPVVEFWRPALDLTSLVERLIGGMQRRESLSDEYLRR